jgi:hypothetical protein
MPVLHIQTQGSGWIVAEDGVVISPIRRNKISAIEWANVKRHMSNVSDVVVHNEDGTIDFL